MNKLQKSRLSINLRLPFYNANFPTYKYISKKAPAFSEEMNF